MRGNNELSAFLCTPMDLHEESQLPLWGQSCLRLIEQIDAVSAEGILCQLKEALSVGFLMEMLRYAARSPAVFIFLSGDVVKTLRAKIIAAVRPAETA